MSHIPDDLADLEQRLARRLRHAPGEALGPRVLAAVARELNQTAPDNARRSFWRFAVGVAAAMLLWLNLSMSAANDMDWSFVGDVDTASITASAERIRQVLPDLPEGEAARQARLAHFASHVPPLPDVKPSLRDSLREKQTGLTEIP
jgi:hypothetical protein